MSRRIILRHTSILVTEYDKGDCEQLEGYFTLYDPITHSKYIKGIIFDEENRQLILPRGLDIYLIEKLLGVEAEVDYNYNEYDCVEPIMIKLLPRDDMQKQTLRFVLGEGEYKHNQRKSQLCVNNNTGSGKTYVGSMTIAYTLYKTIIIAANIGVLDQWTERLKQYTDITERDICVISGAGTVYRLYNNGTGKYKIFMVTHATLNSIARSDGWPAVTELFKFLKVGLKIIDEYHQNFDNIIYIDGFTNVYKSLYLSATPMRSNEQENRIYQYTFKNIPGIDLFDEETDPNTDYIAIRFNSKPTASQVSDCRNQYGLDRNKYVSYLVKQGEFELILYYVAKICKNTNGKVLIYIGVNSSIVYVRDWLIKNFPELRTKIGVYTSIIGKDEKRAMLDRKIILSTTKSCGAAMDIHGLKGTILLAEPFKSAVLARQTLGRTRGKNTWYIEFVDVAFVYTKRYYAAKQPIFQKYAKSCKDTSVSHYQLVDMYNKICADQARLIQGFEYLEENEKSSPWIVENQSPWIKIHTE